MQVHIIKKRLVSKQDNIAKHMEHKKQSVGESLWFHPPNLVSLVCSSFSVFWLSHSLFSFLDFTPHKHLEGFCFLEGQMSTNQKNLLFVEQFKETKD